MLWVFGCMFVISLVFFLWRVFRSMGVNGVDKVGRVLVGIGFLSLSRIGV